MWAAGYKRGRPGKNGGDASFQLGTPVARTPRAGGPVVDTSEVVAMMTWTSYAVGVILRVADPTDMNDVGRSYPRPRRARPGASQRLPLGSARSPSAAARVHVPTESRGIGCESASAAARIHGPARRGGHAVSIRRADPGRGMCQRGHNHGGDGCRRYDGGPSHFVHFSCS